MALVFRKFTFPFFKVSLVDLTPFASGFEINLLQLIETITKNKET